MSRVFPKKRRQYYSHSLMLYLLSSTLIHALFFYGFSRRQPPEQIDIVEITPITIADIPRSPQDNTKAKPNDTKASQPSPSAQTPPAPTPPTKSAPPTPAPKPVAAPPEVKPTPTLVKPDSPVLTSAESKVATQPEIKPEIKTPIPEKPRISADSAIAKTEPQPNLNSQKPQIDNRDKPVKTKPIKPEVTKNTNSDTNDSQADSKELALQPLSASQADSQALTPIEDLSAANNVDTEQGELITAASNSNSVGEDSKPLSINCEANCQPEYPEVLDGLEGSAGIKLTIDRNGKVIDAAIAIPNGNSELNEFALSAAKAMEFSEIDRDRATVQINITFAVE